MFTYRLYPTGTSENTYTYFWMSKDAKLGFAMVFVMMIDRFSYSRGGSDLLPHIIEI